MTLKYFGLTFAVALSSSLLIHSGLSLPIIDSLSHPARSALALYTLSADPLSVGKQQQEQTSTPRKTKIKETKEQRRRRKKKLHDGPFGPPPARLSPYVGPPISQHSIPGFNLNPVKAPWRHRLVYSLDWTLEPDFYDSITPIKVEPSESAASGDIIKERIRGPITMDFFLTPLDTARTNELLVTRVPIERQNAQFEVRTDIPPGWYRLQINFWDRGSAVPGIHKETQNFGEHEPWIMENSLLISEPGIAKPIPADAIDFYQPRRLGVWRGSHAIEVTSLDPESQEWDEFLDLAEKEHQRQIARQEVLSRLQTQEEYDRYRSKAVHLDLDEFSVLIVEPTTTMTTFERTEFPQDIFRFKDALAEVANRDMPPDFSADEIMDLQEQDEMPAYAPDRLAAVQIQNTVEEALGIWRDEPVDDDALDENEDFGALPPQGLTDLQLRIEHGGKVADRMEKVEWRANRDRTISWQTSIELVQDEALFAVELIHTPPVVVWPSNMEEEKKGEGGEALQRVTVSRASLIQGALREPQVALLTDHIPGSWGAIVVRIPAWVRPGAYQVRVTGTGRRGVRWADVSQPFEVKSDPYLYQYLTDE
ncbi:hypothetical protein BG006_006907 [Podila minutissima]|uniref:Uncharacterized protein n=1 Tax=Podila minutissima TaxID=64525 RepID=A0A9P5SKH7_9FUNG|nr:hypothetical protein BG006_006907 [Podila minutissima]